MPMPVTILLQTPNLAGCLMAGFPDKVTKASVVDPQLAMGYTENKTYWALLLI